MRISTLTLIVLCAAGLAFYLGKRRALNLALAQGGPRTLHSMPGFYGAWTALWAAVPALLLIGAWLALEPTILRALLVASLVIGLLNAFVKPLLMVISMPRLW